MAFKIWERRTRKAIVGESFLKICAAQQYLLQKRKLDRAGAHDYQGIDPASWRHNQREKQAGKGKHFYG